MSDAKTAFLARVSTQNPGECWTWTSVVNQHGYPSFKFKQVRTAAHRWAYLNFIGPIPSGLVLDHTCHTRDKSCMGGSACLHRRCVNPAHLEPVTPQENARRGRSADLARLITHCPKGHEYTEANTSRQSGHRKCRRCHTDRSIRRFRPPGEYVRKNPLPEEARNRIAELRAARLSAGLSQERLAALIGCAGSAVSRWEALKFLPRDDLFAKWSAVLAHRTA
jgi:DNA-binding XRE family transcriptional regulator